MADAFDFISFSFFLLSQKILAFVVIQLGRLHACSALSKLFSCIFFSVADVVLFVALLLFRPSTASLL